MELLQLRYFYMVAQTGNISHTAAYYMVSPSSISHSISKLEKEIGITLFDRTQNRIKLNENGRKFAGIVKKSLSTLDDGLKELSEQNFDFQGALNILLYSRLIPIIDASAAFQQTYPQVTFKFTHYSTKNIHFEDYDLFLAFAPPQEIQNIKEIKLCDYDIWLEVSKDNPLSFRKTVSIAQLKNEKFFVVDQNTPMWKQVRNMCRECGFEPQTSFSADFHPFTSYVGQNLGCLITLRPSNFQITNNSENNVVLLKISGTKKLTLSFFYDANKTLSKTASFFLSFAKDYFSNLQPI